MRWASSIFNVHSLVRAKTKLETERVGNYMSRTPSLLSSKRFWSPKAGSVTDGVRTRPSQRWAKGL